MIRIAALLVLSTTACLTGEFTDEPTPPDDDAAALAATVPIRIVQHNVEKRLNVIQSTLHKAMMSGAEAITLQEVCPDQLQWLRDNYGSRWTIGSVTGKRPAATGCDLPGGLHAIPNDVVIYLGGTGANVDTFPILTQPPRSPGQMVCLKFERAKVDVHVCSAHLVSADWTDPDTMIKYDGEALRENETTRIKQVTLDWIEKGHFVVVGGDFNGKPSSAPLDKMYDGKLGGNGRFTEYNRSGAGRDGQTTAMTSGDNTENGQPYAKKIDYVFFSTNRAPIDGPNVDLVDDDSDHDMLTSTAHMKKKL